MTKHGFEQFLFRTIEKEEIEEAISIEQICFPPNEACSPKAMRERVQVAAGYFLVAIEKESGKIAGFLNGVCTAEEEFRDEFFTDISLHTDGERQVMLLGLDVLPAYRNKSLASEIVRRYAALARKKGAKRLVLTCLEEKVSMYVHMGFRDLGIANSTWGGEQWHAMDFRL